MHRYHAHEISLEGPAGELGPLRRALAEAFPSGLRVASVHHGREALEQPAEDGRVVALDLAGTRTRWELPTHPDAPLAGSLCAWADLALVEGTTSPQALRVVHCRPDTPIGEMAGAIALTGERPERTPPGGIPFFGPQELPELAAHLAQALEERLRERPVLGLVAGARSPEQVQELSGLLEGLVESVFVATEASAAAALPSWLRPVARGFAGAGFVGDLLAASASLPGASLLVVSGREGDQPTRAAAERVLEGRLPLLDATALHGAEDSLPRNGAVLWEPKGLARLWAFLGAGARCPQRILNQARTGLIEP